MKKAFFRIFSLIFLTSIIFTSCEDVEPEIYTGDNFVFFTQNLQNVSISENVGEGSIEFSLSSRLQNDVTVNFQVIDSTAVQGVDFELVSNSVTIPAGEFSANLIILPVDNDIFNASKAFQLSIQGVSIDGVNIGNANVNTFQKNVIIVNDDCPSQSNLWWGNITFDDVGFGTDIPAVGSANDDGDCDILIVSGNLPNNGAGDNDVYPVFFTPFFDGATSGTAEIPFTLYRSAVNFGASGILDTFYGGSGTYDEATGEITIFYTVEARNPDSGALVGNWFTGTTIIKN